MSRKSTFIVIGILAVMTVLFFVMMAAGLDVRTPEPTVPEGYIPPAQDEEPVDVKEPDELLFSIDTHILKDEQYLFITPVSGSGDIFYTTDGTEPGEGSERYDPDTGIPLTSHRNMKCNLVSARMRFDDGSWSRIYTDSWFVGRIADERYNTPIISISSDPHGLFDYFDGIMVEGVIRDEYRESHPHEEINPSSPANYNKRGMESERAAHVTMYLDDGTEVVNQDIGIRVNGGWSRDHPMKSLRLIARYDYDYTNKFNLELFVGPHDAVGPDNTYIRSQQRLTLRNNANDAWGAYLREEAISLGARAAGFADAQSARPVSVYLNGEYYGFMWMHETFDDEYFSNRYGKHEGTFEILEGGETAKTYDEESELGKDALKEWNEIIRSAKLDMTDDIHFLDLCEKLDVDNYLRYYAIEIYVGNTDWPQNNHKIYRYYAAEGEEYRPGTVFDGRWRMLLFDTEFGFGLAGNEQIDSLGRVLTRGDGGYSPLFTALMKRDDCRERFVGIVTDLWNGAYNMYYFSDLISDLSKLRYNELDYNFSSKYSQYYSVSSATSQVTNMKNVAEARAKRMQRLLEKHLGETKTVFSVEYDPGEIQSTVRINGWTVRRYESETVISTRRTYPTLNAEFIRDYECRITPVIADGEVFSHWIVDGEPVYDAVELVIRYDDCEDGHKTVQLVTDTVSDDRAALVLKGFYSGGGSGDYIDVYNPTSYQLRTAGYALSDDSGKPNKYVLPVLTLEPGETLRILCRNNTGSEILKHFRANFSLTEGEKVILSRYGREICSTDVPRLKGGGYYARDRFGMWKEILQYE